MTGGHTQLAGGDGGTDEADAMAPSLETGPDPRTRAPRGRPLGSARRCPASRPAGSPCAARAGRPGAAHRGCGRRPPP
jgi:hypothetical protein